MSTLVVYISIGNSDDKLTQREWSAFTLRIHLAIDDHAKVIHGSWYSGSAAEYQNACWCAEIPLERVAALKGKLRLLSGEFRQDSIAWAGVPVTEFLGPGGERS